MSRHGGPHGYPDSRRHDDYVSRGAREISLIEIIAMLIIMVIGGIVLFGAVSQARASALRSDPTLVASADLASAVHQIQLQKFQPCTSSNPEPYNLSTSVVASSASAANLAIATTSLPLGQAPSDGKSHPYFARLSTINGVSDFNWSVTPALPAGLSLSADGVISGVPQTESSGIYTFTVVSNGNSDSKELSLTVVSVEVQVNHAHSNWTSCQKNTDSLLSKSLVGSARSGGQVARVKSRDVQQVRISTTVQGQKLIRTVTLAS